MNDPVAAALPLLRTAEIHVEGRLVGASNATLYGQLRLDGQEAPCVYKPVAGERPLWDFPDGTLAGRELATYLLSEASGWSLVPPTVLRDGPFGPGMCQLWIEGETGALVDVVPAGAVPAGWRSVLVAEDGRGAPVELVHADDPRLRRLAVLDVVANNGDRKGGHLVQAGGRLFGVDHGVSFSTDPKLRTVLWGWAGEALTSEETSVVGSLAASLDGGALAGQLCEHLTPREVRAALRRAEKLLQRGTFPRRGGTWPSIPWPPF